MGVLMEYANCPVPLKMSFLSSWEAQQVMSLESTRTSAPRFGRVRSPTDLFSAWNRSSLTAAGITGMLIDSIV